MNDMASQPSTEARPDAELRARNLRLALILASAALVFFVGFVVKTVVLSQH
jgi:uncharacterized membrane protein (DUF485 family)